MFPGATFLIFFIVNLLVWSQQSSQAVPFGTLFALCFLWLGISVPLVFVGSYFGYKKPAPEVSGGMRGGTGGDVLGHPCGGVQHDTPLPHKKRFHTKHPQQDPVRTNKIPRQIPEQPWYMNPTFSILVGGILPFGAVFIELFFILTSMWQNQFYYLFGFLCLVFLILIITCAEITIVLCYFQLCSEDYHWWWRSYFTSGSSAIYLFLYSLFYFYTKLEIESVVPMLMYFGYMFMISYSFFCLTGLCYLWRGGGYTIWGTLHCTRTQPPH